MVPEMPANLARAMEKEITLLFSDLACTSSALVGGKGAQLAQLTQIEENVSVVFNNFSKLLYALFMVCVLVVLLFFFRWKEMNAFYICFNFCDGVWR